LCIKCERRKDCEITLYSIISLLKLMDVSYYYDENDPTYVIVPDDVAQYIMALAGVGLWAELRGRAEPC